MLSQNTATTTTAPITQTTDPPSTEQATTDTDTPTPSETCGGSGWRRVAFINMTDPNQDCPQGFNLSDYSVRSCSRVENGFNDCSNSVTFSVDSEYSQVCGRATAYRFGQHSAFFGYNVGVRDIDEAYVDGLSLTHGSPRTHIWTFASGLFNGTSLVTFLVLFAVLVILITLITLLLHMLGMTIFVIVLQQWTITMWTVFDSIQTMHSGMVRTN